MCLFPKLIKNRKYTANKKNGGNIPPIIDDRTKLVPVGCQKCMECRKQKARGWRTRLLEEVRYDNKGRFITLTFSTEALKKYYTDKLTGYNLDNHIAKRAIREFLERWRYKYKKSVKHWLITELGGGRYEHVHIHGILWTEDEKLEKLEEIWQNGYIYIGYNKLNSRTANYVTKYMYKMDGIHKEYVSKIFSSKGIGANYINRIGEKHKYKFSGGTIEYYTLENGNKTNLPTYYRNKLWDDDEREDLWIELLNKGKRYVDGVECNANDEETYYKLLKTAREKSKRLGYGDDSKNWEQKQYENERRKLIYKERFKTP